MRPRNHPGSIVENFAFFTPVFLFRIAGSPQLQPQWYEAESGHV
jgi:hypothetical protein